MSKPVLMMIDDDPDGLGTLDGTLRGRYERDYLVISEAPPPRPLAACGSCGPPAGRWRWSWPPPR